MAIQQVQRILPNIKTTLLCVSAAYIAIGAVLLIFPEVSLSTICMVIGILALIIGVINITSYFLKKGYLVENQISFSIGAAELLFGLYAVIRSTDLSFTFTQVMAICMVFDSILKLQYSTDLLRLGCKTWWLLLITAVVTAGLAMAVLLYPFETEAVKLTYTYSVLIADGVVNIISIIWMKIQTKKYQSLQRADSPSEGAEPEEDPEAGE